MTTPAFNFVAEKCRKYIHHLPDYMRQGMMDYIMEGVRPGHFLQAVISNNLKEACHYADDTNQHRLFDYILFLHNAAPMNAWGSKKHMESWIMVKGARGKLL